VVLKSDLNLHFAQGGRKKSTTRMRDEQKTKKKIATFQSHDLKSGSKYRFFSTLDVISFLVSFIFAFEGISVLAIILSILSVFEI